MSRTTDYLEDRVRELREAEAEARAKGDYDSLGGIEADLAEMRAELSNARYYDSLED